MAIDPLDTTGDPKIALALSGGGVRAVAFHAGVLRWLAEKNLLDKVVHVSSVSGGSLMVGLVFQLSECQWPSLEHYLSAVAPDIRTLLTTKSLQFDMFLRLMNPLNWRYVLSRANILAKSIRSVWNVSGTLGQFAENPVWSINGTTAENGRRFRFKAGTMGDYETGYARANDFEAAAAMAISAAFPGGIGPLRIDTGSFKWLKRDGWDSQLQEQEIEPPHPYLHVYDGGVYDNLGMETLFDMGKQAFKTELTVPMNFMILSDAGMSYSRKKIPGPLNLRRFERIADIMSDQTRALRIRSFVNFLTKNQGSGMYLQIGSSPLQCIKTYARAHTVDSLLAAHRWFSAEEAKKAAGYRTSLRVMDPADYDKIEEHGYQTALWNGLVF
jgi:NTE family protein